MDLLIEATAFIILLAGAYGLLLWLLACLGFLVANVLTGFRLFP